jgi:hypothetical protein
LRIHDKRCYAKPNKAVAKASNKAIDAMKKMFDVSINSFLTVILFKIRMEQELSKKKLKMRKKQFRKKQRNPSVSCRT